MWVTILISAAVMALIFALIAIRIIVKKDGEFRGTCATNNPMLRARGVDCQVCHGDEEVCATTRQAKA
ncbi:MAG: membrane or secreted protein [Bacteroidia bacterium]